MNDALTPFVPRLAVELGARPTPSWNLVEGSMLSADISGFTALSEKLAGKGKAGAEEITDLVNRCFTALIGAAYEFGGEVLKFGGDALLVLFRGDNHGRRAVDAGLEMQRQLHTTAAARRASLTMTVGVAGGPFNVFLVGSGYRELLVTGPRASEVIRLEGEAVKGETLVSEQLAELLPPAMLVREESGGVVVTGHTGDERPGAMARLGSDTGLDPYVPAAVREQLAAFDGLGGEHRLVTVGFLMVTGVEHVILDRTTVGAARAFHDLVDDVVSACTRFGVTALHTDIAPDGIKFVLCAGAPLNPGDTSDAMLRAALAIAESATPFVLRQGIQTGRVFAGFLGSEVRKTYTLMGDPVNTAARMLGKADDRDIVAVESVVDDTRTIFETHPIEPFLVKGKIEPITAHKVTTATDDVRRDSVSTRLMGRRNELETLTSAIGSLDEVVVIEGPAGVGKSRLLDAAWDISEGVRIFQAACTPYGATSPYSVFRPLLRSGAGIEHEASPQDVGDRLRELVGEIAPELLPMLPLLALPFGATVDATPEADAIDPSNRRQQVHDVVASYLDARLYGPVLLVAEDMHWADDASAELVNHLIRVSIDRPWSAVFTRREEGLWAPPDDLVTRISLDPLTDDDIKDLAIEATERPLSDADLDVIAERAAGNPLFAIELARARSRYGDTDLPDSIEQVIASRIDELPPDQRRIIRVASVFGRTFRLDQVASVVGEPISSTVGLLEVIEPVDDDTHRFRHAMHRDAAYGGLPFRHRQALHGQVAEVLESATADPASVASVLALHYSIAHRRSEAWHYASIAGEAAMAQYSHREAADAFERALDAASHMRGVAVESRRQAAEHLGDALLAVGEFDRAFKAYSRARRYAVGTTAVDLMRRLGYVRERQGKLTTAIRWLQHCLELLPDKAGSSTEIQTRLDVELALAGIRHRQGRFDDCLRWAERAADEARSLDDRERLARAMDRLHLASTYLGHPDADRYGPEALALHRELGDHLSQARTLGNMGIQAYFASEWDRAVELYDAAAAAGHIAGDVIEANVGRANAAEVWSDRGRFDLAETVFTEVLRNWSAAGWRFGVAGTRSNLALVRARRGDTDRADTVDALVACTAEFEVLGAEEFVTEGSLRVVEALNHIGDHAAALDAASSIATGALDAPGVARLERQRSIAAHAQGGFSVATESIRRSIEAARSADARYQLGLSLLTATRIDGDEDAGHEGRDVLRELGVVALPAGIVSIGVALNGVTTS